MTPQICNCSRCGAMYIENGTGDLCRDCADMLEENYQKIRRYLRKHPGETPAEVSSNTGIDIRIILKLLRQGRLSQ